MRVLWLCNIMLPVVAKAFQKEVTNREGWLTGACEQILDRQKENKIELFVCFPVDAETGNQKKEIPVSTKNGEAKLTAYSFVENVMAAEIYDSSVEARLLEILEDAKPDIVHCFGTEYPHTLAMTRVYNNPKKTLIAVQGLCSCIGEDYRADLPDVVWNRKTFRDRAKKDSLPQQQEKMLQRGEYEREAIRNVLHIAGRTPWDRENIMKWNPKGIYHVLNETLRPQFYQGRWNYDICQKHRIFLSQGDYPLKGLHYVLRAMPEVLKDYPDTEIYVGGNSIVKTSGDKGMKGVQGRLKLESYGLYIRDLLMKCNMTEKIHFLGKLDADEMKEQYLKSHLFICPSKLENSPNSLGEAMILGVPCIASKTGGIPGIFAGGDDGPFVTPGDEKELAEAIKSIFENRRRAEDFAETARFHALRTHDPEVNYERLIILYKEM